MSVSGARSPRGGFTLLEVFLTMSLAVVIAGLVAGAVRTYVVEMDTRELEIRRVMLASAVLDRIETDLRAALHPPAADAKTLDGFLQTSLGVEADASFDPDADFGAAGLNLATIEADAAPAPAIAPGGTLRPGMLGTETVIRFDVSHVPRIEDSLGVQFSAGADLVDPPSDIKTIGYLIQSPGDPYGVADPLADVRAQLAVAPEASPVGGGRDSPGGLVRRRLDRVATGFALGGGGMSSLAATGQIIAPEVVSIAWAYWDGTVWSNTWDSDELETLPRAVRVTIGVRPPGSSGSAGDVDADDVRSFTHLVRLPAAAVPDDEVADAESEGGGTPPGSTPPGSTPPSSTAGGPA